MLLALCVVLALATVPVAGGRLRDIANVSLRAGWTLPAALALQVLVISVFPDAPRRLLVAGHLLSYVAAGSFVLANRYVPGWWVIGAGGLCNFVAIAANGGVMPAAPAAVEAAGLGGPDDSFANSAVVADPKLAWLGDVFAVPQGWPFANVFSVGDVLLGLGAVVALHGLAGSRPFASRTTEPEQEPGAADTGSTRCQDP